MSQLALLDSTWLILVEALQDVAGLDKLSFWSQPCESEVQLLQLYLYPFSKRSLPAQAAVDFFHCVSFVFPILDMIIPFFENFETDNFGIQFSLTFGRVALRFLHKGVALYVSSTT